MSSKLFENFDPVSAKAFKQQIQFDLKGMDYNDSVVWNSPEGIDVKPFYNREDVKRNTSIPGHPLDWIIGEDIFILDPQKSAQTAYKAVEQGADALFFSAEKSFDVEQLFERIKGLDVPIYFKLDFLNPDFLKAFSSTHPLFLNLDPIGHLARTGNWFKNKDLDFEVLDQVLAQGQKNTNYLSIDAGHYQNAGGTMVQQLAYALAHANEYLNAFAEKLTHHQLVFQVSISGNYFFEIAKVRALRLLYATLAASYDLPETCHIIARPSRRNKVIYDYNTNMLRTTIECMSAVLGGADTIVNLPYDALYHKINEFGQRISRNQLLVLKSESYFDAVSNPADGAYYIESLTQQLAEKALVLFKDIEQQGGFLDQLFAGTIQRKIKESAAREQSLFDTGENVLLGTNSYPNPQDRMKKNLELYPFLKQNPRKTLIEPILARRLAEGMEKERLEKEKE